MYNSFFGFHERPFNVTPDPGLFYSSPVYQRTHSSLLSAICERKKVIVLTGEAGTGKTTILHRLMQTLAPSVRFVFCPYPMLSFAELLDFVCDDLELAQRPVGQAQRLEALRTFLIAQQQHGQHCALLIDEAHNLQLPVLGALAQLVDCATGDEALLPIVLVGQPELDDNLNHPTAAALKQAVALACQLDRLKQSEVGAFIFHRLRAAGCEGYDIFPPDAVDRIAEYAQGIPRSINTICDNALMIACTQAKKVVTGEIIDEVAKDLQLPTSPLPGTENCSPPYRPELSSTEGLSTQQPAAVSTRRRPEEKFLPLYLPGFFPRPRRPLITRSELSAVSVLLFLLLALLYFSAAPKPDVQRELARESAPAQTPPPLTSLPYQPAPGPVPQHKPLAPPPATNRPPAEDQAKPTSHQFTIATANTTPPAPQLEQQKSNPDAPRDPSALEVPPRAEKGGQTLSSGDKRSPEQQRGENNEKGGVASAGQPTLLTNAARETSPEGKPTAKPRESAPLALAVMRGRTAVVEELLKNGANVNEQNASGRTPLMFAALAGKDAILQALLDKGAAVDAANDEGWTALMYAAWNGHTEVVQTLLRNGANVDARSVSGGTALSYALRNGHNETARLLRMGRTGALREDLPNKSPVTRLSRFRDAQSVALLKPTQRR